MKPLAERTCDQKGMPLAEWAPSQFGRTGAKFSRIVLPLGAQEGKAMGPAHVL
ncbi:unnamed protein product [Amoebophrya sp. A25]|nr:unnamed protein product [Amoebophrya sp. A25]|eukprot:GSA25T00006675001.1